MDKVCLDFEAALDFLRGEKKAMEKVRLYAEREEVCVTAFAIAHLNEAIRKPEVVTAFSHSVNVLPFDKKSVAVLNRLIAEARERQQQLKTMDHLVTASICIANDALLYAKTPENYEGVKGLKRV